MSDIFISYSRSDFEFAKRLTNELKKLEKDVWIDWEDIPGAADWFNEIYAGIESADAFVFIVSPRSLISEICNYELHRAFQCGKRVIPIIHEPVTLNSQLIKTVSDEWELEKNSTWNEIALGNWQSLQRLNWVFFDANKAFDDAFRALLEAATTDISHVKQHTRLLVRARDWEQNSNNPSFLLAGDELKAAETWLVLAKAENKQPPPNTLHETYIVKSREAEIDRDMRLNQLRRQTRIASGASAVALIFIIALGGLAWGTNNLLNQVPPTLTAVAGLASLFSSVAGQNGNEAVRLLNLAQQEMDTDPNLATLLAIRSLRTVYSPQGDEVLVEATGKIGTQVVLRHNALVDKAEFSPDGQRLITQSNKVSYLWNPKTGELITNLEPYAHFSLDSRYIVPSLGTGAGTANDQYPIYDAKTGKLARFINFSQLPHYDGEGIYANSQFVFTQKGLQAIDIAKEKSKGTSLVGRISTWNPETGDMVDFENIPINIPYSTDEYMVIQTELENNQRQYQLQRKDTKTDILRLILSNRDKVRFSPQGNYLITWSTQQVHVYNVSDGLRVMDINTPSDNRIIDVITDPNGTVMAVFSNGQTQIWGVQNRELLAELPGTANFGFTPGLTAEMAWHFTPDSQYLLTPNYIWSMRSSRKELEFSDRLDRFMLAVTDQADYAVVGYRNGISAESNITVNSVKFAPLDNPRENRTFEEFLDYVCEKLIRDFTLQERQQFGITDQNTTCPQLKEFTDLTATPAS